MPNHIKCYKFMINRNISKNPKFEQKTKVEGIFTKILNCFYWKRKTSPVRFY